MLLCCATALSDVTVKARIVAAEGMIPVRKMPCRVQSIARVAQDVAVVKLQLPATEKFDYLAGQYIDILLKDGKRRSYSMASAPIRTTSLSFIFGTHRAAHSPTPFLGRVRHRPMR